MASTSEWLHFQQNTNNHNHPSVSPKMASPYTTTSVSDLFFSGQVSEATVVSTTMTPTTNSLQSGEPQAQLGPDGRVSKPTRRRTRASRKTPTTLLNTDTSNFRAMVQQFTGGPCNTFSPMGNLGQLQHGGGFSTGPGSGYGMQFPVGQLQYNTSSSAAAMSLSSTTNNMNTNPHHANNTTNPKNIFMQRMSDGTLFTTRNNNVGVALGGSRSSSSENRSNNNSFRF